MVNKRKHRWKRKKNKLFRPETTSIVKPQLQSAQRSIKRSLFKRLRILLFFIIVSGISAFFLIGIPDFEFSASLNSFDEISFNLVKPEATQIKSPICGCPNDSIFNYGILMTGLKYKLYNSNSDSTSFSITAPSEHNTTVWGSFSFSPIVVLFEENPILNNDIDSISFLKRRGIRAMTVKDISFISVLSRAPLQVRQYNEQCISAIIPAFNARMSIRYEKNNGIRKKIIIKHSFDSDTTYGDHFSVDFLGTTLVYSDNAFGIITEKTKYSFLTPTELKLAQENRLGIAVFMTPPFISRISICNWSNDFEGVWTEELMTAWRLNHFDSISLVGVLPTQYYQNGGWKQLDLSIYDTLESAPPIYEQRKINTTIEVLAAPNQEIVDSLNYRFKVNEGKTSSFTNDFLIKKAIVKEIDSNTYFNQDIKDAVNKMSDSGIGLEERQTIGRKIDKELSKFTLPVVEKRNMKASSMQFYYPQYKIENGITIYNGLSFAALNNARGAILVSDESKEVMSEASIRISSKSPISNEGLFFYYQDSLKNSLKVHGEGNIYIDNKKIGRANYENPFLLSFLTLISLATFAIAAYEFIAKRK